MRFSAPTIAIYFLWLTLALALFFFWAERSYGKLRARFADSKMIPKLTNPGIRKRRAIRAALDIAAVFLIGAALARPQWGLAWQQKPEEGIDILFALDLSKSMLAGDIEPDRLSYAKKHIRYFVERLEGDRVGLIGFAGDAFLFCPLTADRSGFFLTLNDIGVKDMPRGGTFFMAAVKEAVKAFSWSLSDQKVLIVISDGEITEGDAASAAAAAKKEGVEINCVGVGTREGSRIAYDDAKGSTVDVKDENGRAVTSRLDEAALATMAGQTGGICVRAEGNSFGLDRIYKERLSKLKKRQAEEALLRSYREQFQYPLAIAFLALLAHLLIGTTERYEKN